MGAERSSFSVSLHHTGAEHPLCAGNHHCWGCKDELDVVAFPEFPSPVKYGVCGEDDSYLGCCFFFFFS